MHHLSKRGKVVIELPSFYALQPAEYFSLAGVGILDAIGAQYISYGTEAKEKIEREIIADFISAIYNPSKKFEELISKQIKEGNSYPSARMKAFEIISSYNDVSMLKSPNAILEIAYRSAINKLNSKITPIPMNCSSGIQKSGARSEQILVENRGDGLSLRPGNENKNVILSGGTERRISRSLEPETLRPTASE